MASNIPASDTSALTSNAAKTGCCGEQDFDLEVHRWREGYILAEEYGLMLDTVRYSD